MRPRLTAILMLVGLLGGCGGAGGLPTAVTTVAPATTSSTPIATTAAPASTSEGPTTTTATVPALVDDYGCGFGFFVGAEDQSAGLFVYFLDGQAAAEGRIPESFELPSDQWQAEVRVGANLFAHWCDDVVVMPALRVPTVDEIWPVVAGTITILRLPDATQRLAKARLTGFTALTSSGLLVNLGDFEVDNTCWGCLPG